ncbi:MAG: nucleotidyltransferase domain-containing protein [Chloroflexi bacterium]|nr:nucleotidyltransferase domain-containing protein [Chloroflexota bacterium]
MSEMSLAERIRQELPHLAEAQVAELARVVQRLVEHFQPERIYVFGSQARGEATPDSDVDLMIVMTSAEERDYRLAQRAYAVVGVDRGFSLDLLFMPEEEFRRRARARASLPATILREGKVLYAA